MLSPESPYRKAMNLITKDAYTHAHNIIALLQETPKSRHKKEQYLGVINYAITKFEEVLAIKEHDTLSTLELNTLIERCQHMINAIRQAVELTKKTFSLEKILTARIKQLKAHEKSLNDEIASAREKLNEMTEDFNPLCVNEIPNKLQSKIHKIRQETDTLKQEAQLRDLLNKIDAFLNANNAQPNPEDAPAFRETLDLMKDSLLAIVNKLSPHPLSKIKKLYTNTEHSIFKLTMTHTVTHELEMAPALQTQVASKTPEETSTEPDSDKVVHLMLQPPKTNRHKKLITIINKFKNNPIVITENDTIKSLEEQLNQYIFSLEMTLPNITKTLRGLRCYEQYLNKYSPKAITTSYVAQLRQNFSEYKYGDDYAKKIVREAGRVTLFGKPAPNKRQPAFLNKHEKREHVRDHSPKRNH